MSFDIIILKPTDLLVEDISMVEDVAPLGTTKIIFEIFNNVFPACIGGAFISGEDYSVELVMNGEPVESAHLALRYGKSWSEESEKQFVALLSKACLSLGGVAFAVSDNSRVAP